MSPQFGIGDPQFGVHQCRAQSIEIKTSHGFAPVAE
jgi:hypothetical protein